MNVPVLLNFLNDVPLPLVSLLVNLAPCISFIRLLLDSFSWTSPDCNPWLLLASWWLICLSADFVLRYLLPFVIFLALCIFRPRPAHPLLNELVLQSTISDLQSILSLLPSLPSLPDKYILARVLLLLYIPYLILTWCIRLRILIALVGTILLTHRAPWAIVLRGVLWRSAYVRWSIYYLWSQLSGQPLSLNAPPNIDVAALSHKPVNSLRFLFTVYENQRWWVGLDWTAALLPGERPSWCSAAQHPVSPPNAFPLPRTAAVTLCNGTGKPLKRTAFWKWEEPEWRVVVRRGDGGMSRVERPLPSIEKEASSRLTRGKTRDPADQNLAPGTGSTNAPSDANDDAFENVESTGVDDPVTDLDGWVYGDNKWENLSSKGGMGKYTRFRRWTRIATVHESVEEVEGDQNETAPQGSTESLNSTATADEASAGGNNTHPGTSPLRQRLINALKQPGANSHGG